MISNSRTLSGLLLASALTLATGDAFAYVRRTTSAGKPVYWASGCAWVFPDTGVPPELTQSLFETTLSKAVANWQSVTLSGPSACSYLKIDVNPAAAGEATYDGKNIVKFRQDSWCRPADSAEPVMCFSTAIASVTTTIYDPSTGQILDNDIELNSINFSFLIEPTTTSARDQTIGVDFEGTLTHELGHFQGLDHTCWDHLASTPPLDGDGTAIPDCNTLTTLPAAEMQAITSTTMYPYPQPGDTSARTPKADDIAGICAIYPLAANPKTCTPPPPPSTKSTSTSESECDVGAVGAGRFWPGLWVAAAVIAAGIAARAPRRRRQTRA